MRLPHLGLMAIVVVLWGLNYPVGKIGIAAVPPIMMIALRFAIVALLLVSFVKMPRGQMRALFLLSVNIGLLHFAPNFTGLKGVDSGVGALLNQLGVPFAAILAFFVFKDRLGWQRVLGLVLAFAGVAILIGEPQRQSNWWSAALMIFAAFSWAVSLIQAKMLKGVSPLSLVCWMTLMAAPQLALCSILVEDRPVQAALAMGWNGWGPILFQAVFVSIVSHGLWYALLQRYPVNVVNPFALLTPVASFAFGIAVLGEPLTAWTVAGAAVAIGGVALTSLLQPRAPPPRAA